MNSGRRPALPFAQYVRYIAWEQPIHRRAGILLLVKWGVRSAASLATGLRGEQGRGDGPPRWPVPPGGQSSGGI
jgi:hypothetical protein